MILTAWIRETGDGDLVTIRLSHYRPDGRWRIVKRSEARYIDPGLVNGDLIRLEDGVYFFDE